MDHILFLRLAGPMQSWGVMSRFSRRDTGKEPSKSGVIGLISAAMGIDREDDQNEDLKKLADAKFGVRVLRQGVLQSDYHTASDVAKADGGTKTTELSTRFYLSDADFIAAFQSDDLDLLERVHAALKKPVWQLFLGRKAFVPHVPVYVNDEAAIVDGDDLETSLRDDAIIERLGISKPYKDFDTHQRVVLESEDGSEIRQDVPISFAKRQFAIRRVHTTFANEKVGESNGTTIS